MTSFLRRTWHKYSKLGKGRKKKQVWRRPTGRDNKMREKRRGYPATVSIGYKAPKKEQPTMITSLRELEACQKGTSVLLAKMGAKKRAEITKKAETLGLTIVNKTKPMEKKQ